MVNDLIRKARAQENENENENEWIRAKLIRAEKSGFTTMTRDEILAQSKEELRRNGEL